MGQPVIGVTANRFDAEPRRHYTGKALDVADTAMVRRVIEAGGVPIVLPITGDEQIIDRLAALIDGLLLTGGADVDPSTYGHPSRGWPGQPERDRFELRLVERLRAQGSAILGVCRGHQLLNVAFGGSLLQDISSEHDGAQAHREDTLYDQHQHSLTVVPNSLLAAVLGGTSVVVNSVHHQAIDQLGVGLEPLAWAPDGLVEAVRATGDRWTYGVQWHPEWDPRPEHTALFERFVEAARCDD